jgi:hypothetical protein
MCSSPAVAWQRTGLCAGGLVRAAYACAAHEASILAALNEMRIDDVAAITSTRTARAARVRAARLRDRAAQYGRRAAALVGASSATHTYAAMGCAAAQEADALDRLADLVLA